DLMPHPHRPMRQSLTPLALASLLLVGLAGCSVLEEDKIDYRTANRAQSLEVPPDLTQLRRDSRYAQDGASASALAMQGQGAKAADLGTAVNQVGDVRLERNGNSRFLVVNRPADKVWASLKEFWPDNGLSLEIEQPELGIMETSWAENRAKIPQDVIRRTIGKVLENLYSSGERDKFRTRLERTANGVEIYISHRGLKEEFADIQKVRTIWVPRPNDPELEIEFLRRMMVFLGNGSSQVKSQADAQAKAAASAAIAQPTLATLNGQQALQVPEDLERTWRRVGVALDRTGFTVEDRDRSKGVYFVRYVVDGEADQGFISRLFSRKKDTSPQLNRYRIAVMADGAGSIVMVQTADGKPADADNAGKILKLLAPQIR
ncbi:MAG: outer membrane protein assembly factor BamC, partial [Pseudomonadota bacterium]